MSGYSHKSLIIDSRGKVQDQYYVSWIRSLDLQIEHFKRQILDQEDELMFKQLSDTFEIVYVDTNTKT